MTNEEAIKELDDLRCDIGSAYDDANLSSIWNALGMAIEALKERKTGKWHNYRCPECKHLCTYFLNGEYVLVKRPNHCPYCGVKMEVE